MVIDASVWVSFFTPHDVHHVRSLSWLKDRLNAGGAMVSPVLLLAEVSGSVARRFSDHAIGLNAADRIRANREVRLIPINAELGDLAADLAASLRLRGADATYAAVAYAYDIPLVTWDQELLMRASAVIQTFTPHTALARR